MLYGIGFMSTDYLMLVVYGMLIEAPLADYISIAGLWFVLKTFVDLKTDIRSSNYVSDSTE